jgi:hypothetical protein
MTLTRFRKASLIALAVLFLGVVAAAASSIFTFDTPYSNDVFSAIFPTPGDAKLGVQSAVHDDVRTPSTDGKYTVHMFFVTTSGDNGTFFVAYSDYEFNPDTSTASLDYAIDAAFSKQHAVLVPGSRENAVLGGLFAREAEGVNDDVHLYIRAAVKENRMWVGVTSFKKSIHATQADADKFFDSIKRKGN